MERSPQGEEPPATTTQRKPRRTLRVPDANLSRGGRHQRAGRAVVERRAPQHARFSFVVIPILAPLPNVAAEIINPELVRRIATDLGGIFHSVGITGNLGRPSIALAGIISRAGRRRPWPARAAGRFPTARSGHRRKPLWAPCRPAFFSVRAAPKDPECRRRRCALPRARSSSGRPAMPPSRHSSRVRWRPAAPRG